MDHYIFYRGGGGVRQLVSFVRPRTPSELHNFEAHHVIRSPPIEDCISVGGKTRAIDNLELGSVYFQAFKWITSVSLAHIRVASPVFFPGALLSSSLGGSQSGIAE